MEIPLNRWNDRHLEQTHILFPIYFQERVGQYRRHGCLHWLADHNLTYRY